MSPGKQNVSAGKRKFQQKESDVENDIITLILDHHSIMKESIAVLKEEDEREERKLESLIQFMEMLKMHAKAEEQTLYRRVSSIPELRQKILEAKEEHQVADNLAFEIDEMGYKRNWNEQVEAKAKVLAELVEHHIEEEEQEMFPEVRRELDRSELESLGADYLERCEQILDRVETRSGSSYSISP